MKYHRKYRNYHWNKHTSQLVLRWTEGFFNITVYPICWFLFQSSILQFLLHVSSNSSYHPNSFFQFLKCDIAQGSFEVNVNFQLRTNSDEDRAWPRGGGQLKNGPVSVGFRMEGPRRSCLIGLLLRPQGMIAGTSFAPHIKIHQNSS